MFRLVKAGFALALVACAFGPATAAGGARTDELRDAMERLFERRLERGLGLDREQVEWIVPRVEALERERRELRRERSRLTRELRESLENASDPEIEKSLQRLDALEEKQLRDVRRRMAEIDQVLSPRERAEFRFFLQRFRARLTERVRQIRGERRDVGRAPGSPRRPGSRGRR